ncbi:MAG: cytochrome c3 family protein [Coriobacteriales bacterium]|jgi:hypothetical protein|nr:cytochrome c3 family protein [Coriobacteriales bacterium]
MSDNEKQETREQEQQSTDSVKKKPKRGFIILGVVTAVLIVAGVGGVIWHGTPEFCGAICHNPMGSYVDGYKSDDPTLLLTEHVKQGNECLDCHKATIGEQIQEAQVWLAGDFKQPMEASGIGTREFCLECHDMDDIMEATDDYAGLYERGISIGFQGLAKGLNPHRSHMENLQCGDCHQMHRPSVMQCNECHYVPLPEGWTDMWDGKGSPRL